MSQEFYYESMRDTLTYTVNHYESRRVLNEIYNDEKIKAHDCTIPIFGKCTDCHRMLVQIGHAVNLIDYTNVEAHIEQEYLAANRLAENLFHHHIPSDVLNHVVDDYETRVPAECPSKNDSVGKPCDKEHVENHTCVKCNKLCCVLGLESKDQSRRRITPDELIIIAKLLTAEFSSKALTAIGSGSNLESVKDQFLSLTDKVNSELGFEDKAAEDSSECRRPHVDEYEVPTAPKCERDHVDSLHDLALHGFKGPAPEGTDESLAELNKQVSFVLKAMDKVTTKGVDISYFLKPDQVREVVEFEYEDDETGDYKDNNQHPAVIIRKLIHLHEVSERHDAYEDWETHDCRAGPCALRYIIDMSQNAETEDSFVDYVYALHLFLAASAAHINGFAFAASDVAKFMLSLGNSRTVKTFFTYLNREAKEVTFTSHETYPSLANNLSEGHSSNKTSELQRHLPYTVKDLYD